MEKDTADDVGMFASVTLGTSVSALGTTTRTGGLGGPAFSRLLTTGSSSLATPRESPDVNGIAADAANTGSGGDSVKHRLGWGMGAVSAGFVASAEAGVRTFVGTFARTKPTPEPSVYTTDRFVL